MLTVTAEATTVLNKTTGVAYKTLSEAVAALGDEDTELEVSAANAKQCWELLHAYAKKNGKADKYTEEWVSYSFFFCEAKKT